MDAAAPSNARLRVTRRRELNLAPGRPGQSTHVYAASGLVASGGDLYMVADDEMHLACFPAAGDAPGSLLRLLAGELPREPEARKRRKADFEILLRLPALPGFPCGALLALGSGSRPSRERGALMALDQNGRAAGDAVEVDAGPLYAGLASHCGRLNLEGGWLHGGQLRLLQRGTQGREGNAIFHLDFGLLAGALADGRVLVDVPPLQVTPVDLGETRGVRLAFTDACGLPDGTWLFSAVAEDTADAYLDGEFAGATLGLASADARMLWQQPLEPACKVEGIHGEMIAGGLRVLCVTDADDRSTPSQLLEVCIDLPHAVASGAGT